MSIQPLPHDAATLGEERALIGKESHFHDVAQRLRRMTRGSKRKFDPAMRALLEDLLDAAATTEQTLADQRQRITELESLSHTDELTGLLNRRGLQSELRRALARAKRQGEQGLLLVCDLDDFKAINDGYGHPAGDAVLREVAALLRRRTRTSDSVARPGGDEFVVLLTDTPPDRASQLADELSQLLNQLIVPWGQSEIPVSASLGAAGYDRRSGVVELQKRADQALYRQKRQRKSVFRDQASA